MRISPFRMGPLDTLVDSNLLLRFVEPAHPMHRVTVAALMERRRQGATIYACSQNFIEFWAVATRPKSANGLGFDTARAEAELARIELLFPLLPDDPRIYSEWRRLVVGAGVSGKPTHDARLLAVAIVYGIDTLLTYNISDFTRFAALAPTVRIVDPATV